MVAVTLLQREAGVAICEPLGLRSREWNETGFETASLAFIGTLGFDIPAEIGADRHLEMDRRNTRGFIAIGVHPWDQRRQRPAHKGRLAGDDPAQVLEV